MLSYKRSTRVKELIHQEISKIVQDLQNPQLGFVTITHLKLTEDLKSARVFYSVMGDKESVAQSCKVVEELTPHIRHQLAQRLNLRRTPALVFEFDDTPSRAGRVFEILEQIKQEGKK